MHVTLALPTVEPLWGLVGDGEHYISCMADLVAASGILSAHDPTLHSAPFAISHCERGHEHPLVKDRWRIPNSPREFGLLLVSADLSDFARAYRTELASDGRSITESQLTSLVESYAAEKLTFEVQNLVLLANILRPGALSASTGFVFVNNNYEGEVQAFYAEGWYGATVVSQEGGWPTFKSLGILQAWKWLASTGCIDDGIARGSVGRALAALSYAAPVSYDSETSLNLAWVLLGLASLYCTGNFGLREQLVAKSELVLGVRHQNKKAFGAMYDFSSRLLHGDLDLPLRYSPFDGVPDFEKHFDELGDYEGLALAALIATLQTMIANGWSGLSFHYGFNGILARSAA